MPAAAVSAPFPVDRPDVVRRKRFTRTEVAQMIQAGLFQGQRFELFEGELIDKMGQNPPHAKAIRRIAKLLFELFGGDRVLVQAPIQVSGPDLETSEPEPDLAVASESVNLEELDGHPGARDLDFAVEVSDATARFDTTRKLSSQVQYAEIKLYTRTQSVTVAGARIAVAKLPPPAPPRP
jgi:Uma2 family endonuclease